MGERLRLFVRAGQLGSACSNGLTPSLSAYQREFSGSAKAENSFRFIAQSLRDS